MDLLEKAALGISGMTLDEIAAENMSDEDLTDEEANQ